MGNVSSARSAGRSNFATVVVVDLKPARTYLQSSHGCRRKAATSMVPADLESFHMRSEKGHQLAQTGTSKGTLEGEKR